MTGEQTRGRILWLASYPKSGNTWVRLFLANLASPDGTPVLIDQIDRTTRAAGRDLFEEATGLESSELTPDETLRLRREVFLSLSDRADSIIPCEIHDAFVHLPDGRPLIEPAATFAAIYIIRNPLDIAVSLRPHLGLSADAAIDRMEDDGFHLGGRGRTQLRQPLGSWSEHVTSWISAPGVHVLTVRYEDLAGDPANAFARIASHSGSAADAERISRAIEYCDFREVRRQEDRPGIHERSAAADRFFPSGRVGGWRDELTAEHVARIVNAHHEVMRRFGYLDSEGRLTV